MTLIKRLNRLIADFNGYGKEDRDFTAMVNVLYNNGYSLFDGKIKYTNDMTAKHYKYRIVKDSVDGNGDYCEGKTVGYLTAYKSFVRGIDNPYEILAYVS